MRRSNAPASRAATPAASAASGTSSAGSRRVAGIVIAPIGCSAGPARSRRLPLDVDDALHVAVVAAHVGILPRIPGFPLPGLPGLDALRVERVVAGGRRVLQHVAVDELDLVPGP